MRSLALSYSTANNCPLVVVDTLQVLAQFYVLLDIESLPEWLELNRGKSNAVRVEAHGDEQLEQIVAAIEGAELPAVILAVDEVSYWSKPGWLSEGLARAVRYGRHKGISLIITARRAAETARELSGEATVIYAFKTIEPVNLDYFSRIMPPEAVSNLPALEPFYYLRYYVDGTWEVFAPINL